MRNTALTLFYGIGFELVFNTNDNYFLKEMSMTYINMGNSSYSRDTS